MGVQKQSEVLVIVPCGLSKIWHKNPNEGPTLAKDAYKGSPFKLNRQYAERFGDKWVILSAKYGFILPDFEIAGPYEVTFNRKASKPVTANILKHQILQLSLNSFDVLIGLGGKEYRKAMMAAFRDSDVHLQFPFAGLPIGKAMQATKRAIAESQSDSHVMRKS
jgi:hypothetical protein